MKYIGKGFIVGIPARDLTDEEVRQYGRRRLLDSGLYIDNKSRKETRREAGQSPAEVNDNARN